MCHTSGLWTTLNIPNITHNLAIGLSDIHLAYLGKCEFKLLCKNTQLHNKARKLFRRSLPSTKHPIFEKQLYVSVHRMDYIKTCPVTTCSAEDLDSEDTEIYEIEKTPNNQTKPLLKYHNLTLEKELLISLHRLDDKSICQETSLTSHYPDSEDTEIYTLDEKLIGTITFINHNEKVIPVKQINTTKNKKKQGQGINKEHKVVTFKCPSTNCHVHTKSRKAINVHYKKIHVLTHYCTLCTKTYTTPYGLRQHQYMHLLKVKNIRTYLRKM